MLFLVGFSVLGPVLAQPEKQMQRPLEELVNIRLVNDRRLFAVMAALNVAGFDAVTAQGMSEVRRSVRSDLASVDPDLASRLKLFYEEHLYQVRDAQPQVRYTSLALLLTPPPEFELSVKEEEMPLDAWQVRDFRKLVRELYLKAELEKLWLKYEEDYRRELASYEPVLKEVIETALKYFRIPPRIVLDREIVLIPDLLDIKDIVNARNLERIYYIVVGPSDSARNNYRQLEHEYLHFLVDPLVRKFGFSLLASEKLLDTAQKQPHIRSDYQNRLLLVATESLIEALQLRLHPPESTEVRDRALVRLFREGLIFSPYFYRGLEQYEQSDLISLPTYMESLLADFRKDEIKKDEAYVAEVEESIRASDEKEAEALRRLQAESEQRRRINQHFDQASELLSERRFPEARDEVEQLLKIDPDNGNANFYLGQIASQLQEYDRALLHYQHAAASTSADDWVRAWAFVRAGRILAAQQQFAAAREAFLSAQRLGGDLRGARDEADQLLSELPAP
jgi:tetratricopeptide (TPR) repeat protein